MHRRKGGRREQPTPVYIYKTHMHSSPHGDDVKIKGY
jgi:hypothetical protein